MQAARYALALLRDLIEGEISLRAMSLVYTTLLSLVPFLALAFSLLKALGVHDDLGPVLERLLAPLGDQAKVISESILGFVDNIKVGVLGSVGVVTLLYTAVSMISKIEHSFNYIWRIGQVRGLAQRFGDYLSVLLIGPVLVFSALGLTASVRSSTIVAALSRIQPFGAALVLLTWLAPYALIVGAFTFMYTFIPNTRVRLPAAAAGGLFAGVAWESASVGFATFVGGASSYSAIYSSFAIVIVLLIWLYLGWLIVLFGCRLSFYVQNPRFLAGTLDDPAPGSRSLEFLAMSVMRVVASRFLAGGAAPEFMDVSRMLAVSDERLERAVAELKRHGLLAETEPGRRLLPARDPSTYTVGQLWTMTRGSEGDRRESLDDSAQVLDLLAKIEREATAASGMSVSDWLRSGDSGKR